MYCVVMDYVLQGANDIFTLSPVYDKNYAPVFKVKQKHKYQIPTDNSVYAIGAEFAVGDIVFYDSKDKKQIKKPVHNKSYETVLVNSMEIEDVFGSTKKRKVLRVFGARSGLYTIWVDSDDDQFENIKEGQELLSTGEFTGAKVIRNFTIENWISQFVKKHHTKTI